MEYWGDKTILNNYKTAFLCSQKCSANTVLKSYNWAKQQRGQGNCVVCGNHSQIEKDVFEILLKGTQPLILVLARGMQTKWPSNIVKAVNEKRLLVCTPFNIAIKRITRSTAVIRNKKIIEISDNIMVGYKSDGGQLEKLLNGKQFNLI